MTKLFTGIGGGTEESTISKEETAALFKARDDKAIDSQRRGEEARKKDLEDMQIECDKQLLEFCNDNSLSDTYKNFSPLGNDVLVKIFRYNPDKKFIGKSLLGRSSIILTSKLDGAMSESTTADTDRYLPIVKVIKAGKSCERGAVNGGIYTVKLDNIEGKVFNPEYLFLLQNFAKQGTKNLTHVPDDMPQRINKIEQNWGKYKFNMPNLLNKEGNKFEDIYLISEIELKSEYTPDGLNI